MDRDTILFTIGILLITFSAISWANIFSEVQTKKECKCEVIK
jgi:hypothetical protein